MHCTASTIYFIANNDLSTLDIPEFYSGTGSEAYVAGAGADDGVVNGVVSLDCGSSPQ